MIDGTSSDYFTLERNVFLPPTIAYSGFLARSALHDSQRTMRRPYVLALPQRIDSYVSLCLGRVVLLHPLPRRSARCRPQGALAEQRVYEPSAC